MAYTFIQTDKRSDWHSHQCSTRGGKRMVRRPRRSNRKGNEAVHGRHAEKQAKKDV